MSGSGQSWPAGPAAPELQPGTVHVWRAALADVGDEVCELLCEQEHKRAERIVNPRSGLMWARSRGVLRALLARYLKVDGATLAFIAGAHGKPALAPAAHPHAESLSFNLSHSGETALYAFAHRAAVGVDVELARQPSNVIGLAKRVFGAAEAERLLALGEDARGQAFIASWVRHEARLKCLGLGIGGAASSDEHPYTPWIADLQLDIEDVAAALAVEREPSALYCWSWAEG